MSVGRIENPLILVQVSEKLTKFVKEIKDVNQVPVGIKTVRSNNAVETNEASTNSDKNNEESKLTDHKYLMTTNDYKEVNNLTELNIKKEIWEKYVTKTGGEFLNLEDLHWVYDKVQEHNRNNKNKIYLHELLEDFDVILPKNKLVPRNPELEKRCNVLKAQQANMQYKNMTKNVDSVLRRHPEDSISYQVKQLNRQLIAVAQFIFSVLAGFAFGFIGLEYILGSLDFGFRLLLGIICALVIALAELYFLAKKLNEETNFETKVQEMSKHSKIN